MGRKLTITELKDILKQEVTLLCEPRGESWNIPIVEVIQALYKNNTQAVFFGGTLRSLLLSRLQHQKMGRPRDIDIVVADTNSDLLKKMFHSTIVRETRFGGLKLNHGGWQFDIWPLDSTWAFQNQKNINSTFSMLPSTTFFNLEAVAVDIWGTSTSSRTIYSGDDRFFKGIQSKILEVNLEDNPFPSLCVVRSFMMAMSTGFTLGPRLIDYISHYAALISNEELKEVLQKHYGDVCCEVSHLRRWIDHVISCGSQVNDRGNISPRHQTLA